MHIAPAIFPFFILYCSVCASYIYHRNKVSGVEFWTNRHRSFTQWTYPDSAVIRYILIKQQGCSIGNKDTAKYFALEMLILDIYLK